MPAARRPRAASAPLRDGPSVFAQLPRTRGPVLTVARRSQDVSLGESAEKADLPEHVLEPSRTDDEPNICPREGAAAAVVVAVVAVVVAAVLDARAAQVRHVAVLQAADRRGRGLRSPQHAHARGVGATARRRVVRDKLQLGGGERRAVAPQRLGAVAAQREDVLQQLGAALVGAHEGAAEERVGDGAASGVLGGVRDGVLHEAPRRELPPRGVALVADCLPDASIREALRRRILERRDAGAGLSSVLGATDADDATLRFDIRLPYDDVVARPTASLLRRGTPLADALEALVGPHAQLWECAALISEAGAPPQCVHADTFWDAAPCLFTSVQDTLHRSR